MPLHAIELLPDEETDAAARRDWQRLHDAGLPSQVDHRGATNAPHVTAVAVPAVDQALRDAAVDLLGPELGTPCRWSGLLVLGERRFVLARYVEVSDALTAAVLRLKARSEGHPFPGWLPHLTLAHGLDAAQVARAMAVIDPAPRVFSLARMRHWDPDRGTATALPDQ